VVTPSGTKGRFNISQGGLYGDGILGSIDSAATFPDAALSPSNGQWYLIVQNRDWGTRTSTFQVRNGPLTAAASPGSVIPAAFPATFEDSPGSSAATEVAWVWVGSGAAQPIIVQLALPPESVYPRRGTVAQRDALTGRLAASAPGRRYLQDLGLEWTRTDRGWTETYFAESSDGNLGGSAAAEWYPVRGMLPFVRDWRSTDGQWNTSAGGTQSVTWNGLSPIARNATWDRVNLRADVAGRYRIRGAIGARAGSGFIQALLYKNGTAQNAAQGRQTGDTTNVQFDFTLPMARGDRANIASRAEVARIVMDAKDAGGALITWLDVDYIGPL
jgi:hypothetical protein